VLGHHLSAVVAERSRCIEISIVSRPDETAVTTKQRRVVNESTFQGFAKLGWHVREPLANRFDI
jgi:hypothetical protein